MYLMKLTSFSLIHWHLYWTVWLHSGAKRQPILHFHRLTIQMAVAVKKGCWDPEICYYGNMSSHSPLLLRLCSKKNWRGPSASTAPSIIRVVFWVIFGTLPFCSVVQCSQAGIYCFVWTEMKNFVVFSILLYMRHQNVHDTALLHDKNCYNR